jgi:hypothetical protein
MRSRAVLGFVVATLAGCGSAGPGDALDVGASEDGSPMFTGSDAAAGGAFDAQIVHDQVAVSLITLACSGDCATVQAVASGGHPPYSFAWDNGSTSAQRQVCPTSTMDYHVTVTDTGTTGDFSQPPQSVTVPLTADVLTCHDGGATELVDAACGASGAAPPAPGHYVGTVSCGPGSMWNSYGAPGGPADGGPTVVGADAGESTLGTISLELTIDSTTAQPSGTWYFAWTLAVIAGAGDLQGSFSCGGSQIDDTFANSQWGLPNGSMGVVPTGTLTGGVTAARVSGAPGAIEGSFTYTSIIAGGAMGDVCVGSYTAMLSAGDD